MRGTVVCACLIALLACAGCARDSADAETSRQIVVFAAASAGDVIEEAASQFEETTGVKVIVNVAATSTLARQLMRGGQADIFVAANTDWMDRVADAGVIDAASRFDLMGNDLVVIVPVGATPPGFDLTQPVDPNNALPERLRVAMGEPSHVPAGRYARQALEALGWWEAMSHMIIPAQDVRAALRLVAMGEADVGIVYATDAHRSNRVRVAGVFDGRFHEPIRYPVARSSDSPEAAAFLDLLRSDRMQTVLREAGFQLLPPAEDVVE